jgi:MFS family permease
LGWFSSSFALRQWGTNNNLLIFPVIATHMDWLRQQPWALYSTDGISASLEVFLLLNRSSITLDRTKNQQMLGPISVGMLSPYCRQGVCKSRYQSTFVEKTFDGFLSFGALLTGYFSGRFGRKPCLLASGVIYVVGSIIQCIVGIGSSPAVGLRILYFSRFFAGIGVGMVSALVPSYVSECTPRIIRGRCTGMIQLANNLGIMLSCA